MNSASLCTLAGDDNPIPPRFLAPIDCIKIPAQDGLFMWPDLLGGLCCVCVYEGGVEVEGQFVNIE